MVEAQILASRASNEGAEEKEEAVDYSLQRDEGSAPIALSLGLDQSFVASKKRPLERAPLPLAKLAAAFGGAEEGVGGGSCDSRSAAPASALQSVMDEERRRKQRAEPKPQPSSSSSSSNSTEPRYEHWGLEGIVVKVLNKDLSDGKYYKARAVIRRVIDFVCEVETLDGGARLRLDQDHLQTVLPRAGQPLLVLNGRARGYRARLLTVHEADFCCDVVVEQGPLAGQQLSRLEYEDVSKLHEA